MFSVNYNICRNSSGPGGHPVNFSGGREALSKSRSPGDNQELHCEQPCRSIRLTIIFTLCPCYSSYFCPCRIISTYLDILLLSYFYWLLSFLASLLSAVHYLWVSFGNQLQREVHWSTRSVWTLWGRAVSAGHSERSWQSPWTCCVWSNQLWVPRWHQMLFGSECSLSSLNFQGIIDSFPKQQYPLCRDWEQRERIVGFTQDRGIIQMWENHPELLKVINLTSTGLRMEMSYLPC